MGWEIDRRRALCSCTMPSGCNKTRFLQRLGLSRLCRLEQTAWILLSSLDRLYTVDISCTVAVGGGYSGELS